MNISLIGMPASGKTTTALALKKLLNKFIFVDIDEKIVQNEKKSINDIFSQNGEEYFRKIETKVLEEVLGNDNQIISTGGGIVKSDKNIKLLKENSFIIYLEANINILIERTKKNKDRPLLNVDNIKNKIEILLNERERKYKQADLIIRIEEKTPDNLAKEIVEKINENSRS